VGRRVGKKKVWYRKSKKQGKGGLASATDSQCKESYECPKLVGGEERKHWGSVLGGWGSAKTRGGLTTQRKWKNIKGGGGGGNDQKKRITGHTNDKDLLRATLTQKRWGVFKIQCLCGRCCVRHGRGIANYSYTPVCLTVRPRCERHLSGPKRDERK